ncbi:MAG: hypothetical protein WCV80_01840 [Candidatus Paceibacterota bacterium]|jgi:membrane protein DedA with SNARE-associated domain
MDNLLDSLGQLVIHYPSWANVIIAAIILIQGEFAVLLSVFLIVSGNLTWGAYLLTAPTALLVGETFAYFVGRTLRNTRFGWKLYRNKIKPNKKYQPYFYYLKMNLTKLLVASKFLVGANLFILLLVGWSKTKFGIFMKSYIKGLAFWFISMTTLAYFLMSGLNYLKTAKLFKQAEYGLVLVFILIFGFEFLLKKSIQKGIPFKTKGEDMSTFLEDEEEGITKK